MSIMSFENLGKFFDWADNKLIPIIETLNEETFTRQLEGTNKSIRDLVEHLAVYYEYFILRKEKIPFRELEEKIKLKNKQDLLNHWKKAVKEFSKSLALPQEEFTKMSISKNETVQVPFIEYLYSYTDHATYHRGQLITTFKAITRQNAVPTDYYDFLVSNLTSGD